jgi:hypothetical protein
MGRAVLVEDEEGRVDDAAVANVSDTDGADELTAVEATSTVQTNEEADDVPEKYRGKSVKDIIRMHQEAEKVLGRHSSEVGELRKVVDEYIRSNTKPVETAQAPKQDDDVVDYFADPAKAIAKQIESHPAVQQAKQLSEQTHRSNALAALQQQHPDMTEILSDERFAGWIKESKIRVQLFAQADQNYDTDAAAELFTMWKAMNGTKSQEAVKADKASRSNEIKKANTGNVRGSAEGVSRKTYRRADIIKLMQTDPTRYEALQPEIMAAYAEGRVI